MIARIREASARLEQDLQLEQKILLAIELHPQQPGLARRALLAPELTRVTEQIQVWIYVGYGRGGRSWRRNYGLNLYG